MASTLAKAIEATPLPIGIRSIRGEDVVHVYDNPAGAALLGRRQEDLQGRTARELGVHEEVLPELISAMNDASSTRRPVHLEVEYASPTAGRRLLRKTFATIPGDIGEHGSPLFLAVAEDITELRAVQGGLVQADRLATLGTLTAAVGHEAASPLLVISASLSAMRQQLGRGAMDRTTFEEHVANAQEACDHLTEVLTSLRDLGRKPDAAATTEVKEAVERAATLASASVRYRVDLRVEVESAVRARGPLVSIAQVLLNLILNAARAAHQAHPDGGGRVDVRGRASATRVELSVTDNGNGIPEELGARLFEPFVTGNASTGGTGLGLYVSRRIAESLNGTLSIDSDGSGTVATFELPLAI